MEYFLPEFFSNFTKKKGKINERKKKKETSRFFIFPLYGVGRNSTTNSIQLKAVLKSEAANFCHISEVIFHRKRMKLTGIFIFITENRITFLVFL